jgi:ribose 5-phosphate isomerase B
MRVAVACDHAGFPYKAAMIRALQTDGHVVTDLGTDSDAPADYPDYARAIGTTVRDGRADAGVIICGSGAGVSIATNKVRGVRAALCHDIFTARQSRQDDDANVLCLGARVIDQDFAIELARTFLGAEFSGAERHRRRLQKVLALERAELCDDDASTEAALAHLESIDAAKRLWADDASLWSPSSTTQAAIVNRLGWLHAPEAMRQHVPTSSALRRRCARRASRTWSSWAWAGRASPPRSCRRRSAMPPAIPRSRYWTARIPD